MARSGTLEIKIVGDHSGLQRSVKGALGTLGGFAKKVGVVGAAAAAAIGVKSVKAFASFDSAMTESLAIMGDVSDTMRSDMSDAAREVGKTTKFSATEAAESYFFLASAGMDAKQSIGALPQVSAFAQAGMFDMATATDLATDAQSALGLTSDDTEENLENLTRTTDVFVKANTLANAKVEEFATSMTRKAGSALQSLNKNIEEGTAALAVFADQGIKGERAGTLLANTLDGLSTRARKSEQGFASLGVEVFNADGEMRNMADIVGDLEGGLAGMSVEQREAELAQLGFNKQAREGILALLGNSEALRDYERDLDSAAGTTQSVADKQMESFSAKMGLIWSKIQDVAISIGQTLVPALEIFAAWLQQHLPAITGWFEAVSSKFEDLFGVSEETTTGMNKHLGDVFVRNAQAHVDGFTGLLDDAGTHMGDVFGRQAGLHADALKGTLIDVKETTDKETADMGEMMSRLAEVWATVFEEDIKPWFDDTFVPWLVDEAAPAVGRAGVAIGKALAKGMLSAMHAELKSSDMLQRILKAAPVPGFSQIVDTVVDLPGSSPSAPRQQTVIPREERAFHDGGIFRTRRPGGEGWALLRDREEVLTPEDRSRRAPQITINNYGPTSDYITGRSAALALRMA